MHFTKHPLKACPLGKPYARLSIKCLALTRKRSHQGQENLQNQLECRTISVIEERHRSLSLSVSQILLTTVNPRLIFKFSVGPRLSHPFLQSVADLQTHIFAYSSRNHDLERNADRFKRKLPLSVQLSPRTPPLQPACENPYPWRRWKSFECSNSHFAKYLKHTNLPRQFQQKGLHNLPLRALPASLCKVSQSRKNCLISQDFTA